MAHKHDDHDKDNKWKDLAEAAGQEDAETTAAPEDEDESSEGGSGERALSFEDLKTQFKKEETRANENWEKLLRLQAEMENLRRRSERDVTNAHKYALDKFANALVPVVDSLERGLQAAHQNGDEAVKALREGTELTFKMFLDVLKRFGVEAVDPLEQAFNPSLHEAVSTQPHETVAPGTVVAVLQKGFKLNDRLLRPALVVVAKEKSEG